MSDNISDIKTFFKAAMYEKAEVLNKEMNNLEKILSFYKMAGINESEGDCFDIKKTCEVLFKNLELNQTKFNKKYESLFSHMENVDEFEALLYYDVFREIAKSTQKFLENVGFKTFQLLEDNLNQYIPYPKINKRFSSKAFTDILQTYYNEIFKMYFGKSEDGSTPTILFYWAYDEFFNIKSGSIEDRNTSANYIRLSFYHHDLVSILPIIAHEIGHLLLKNDKTKIMEIKRKIFETLSKNEYARGVISDLENLAEEIASDIFAFNLHEESYLYAAFQEIAGVGLAKEFFYDPIADYRSPGLCPLSGLDKAASALIRLFVLFDLMEKRVSEKNLSEEPLSIGTYLIRAIFDKLEEKYRVSEIYRREYRDFSDAITNLTVKIIESLEDFADDDILPKKKGGDSREDKITKAYCNFWNKKIESLKNDQIPHKSLFRRYLIDEKSEDGCCKPYVLHLYKVNLRKAEKDFVSKMINNGKKMVFGIYNFMSLEEKDGLEEIKNKISSSNNQSDDGSYYERKYSLVKWKEMGIHEESDNAVFDLLLFVGFKDNCNTNDITNKLEKLENKIKAIGLNHEKIKIEIYKMLGPKDYLIYFNSITIDDIWKIEKHFANASSSKSSEIDIQRTHPIVVYSGNPKANTPLYDNDSDTKIRFKIRLQLDSNWKSVMDNIGFPSNYEAYLLPGVQDLEIEFNDAVSIEKLIELKNGIAEVSSDIQIQIIHSMPLKSS